MKNHEYTATQQVIEIGDIPFQGNITPIHWYKIITFENGKPYSVAITLLSDIVYWYRPKYVRDEQTGQIIEVRKKFGADFMQRQTKDYSELFGFSQKQVNDALRYLEDKGFIKRHFRDLDLGSMGVASNRQFIELIPSKIKEIQKIYTYGHTGLYPQTPTSTPPNIDVTYTDTTTSITTEELFVADGGGVPPPPLKKSEALSKNTDPIENSHSKAKESKRGEIPRASTIILKTAKGAKEEISISDLYRLAITKKKNWKPEEIEYAWNVLDDYESIVYDWFGFIEGVINKYRNTQRSKHAQKLKKEKTCKTTQTFKEESSDQNTQEQASQKRMSILDALRESDPGFLPPHLRRQQT